jgi:hypothetical protein
MATTLDKTHKPMPPDLQAAVENGELSDEQFRELITYEASLLGLDFDEAVRQARDGSLPNDAVGSDLRLLVSMFLA